MQPTATKRTARKRSKTAEADPSSPVECVAFFAVRHPDVQPIEMARHLETDICNMSLAEPDRRQDIERLTEVVVLLVSIACCYPGMPLGKAAWTAGLAPINRTRAAGIR